MVLIIDLAVICLFIYFAMRGYKKGGVKSILEVGSSVVCAIITYFIYKPVSVFLLKLPPAEFISKKIADVFVKNQETTAADSMNLPKGIAEFIDNTRQGAMESLAQTLTVFVLTVLSIVVIYLLVKLAFKFVIGASNIVMKLPVLKSFNKLIGFVFGFVKALIILYIVCFAVGLLIPFEFFGRLNELIQNTFVASYFYNNNILLKFFIG